MKGTSVIHRVSATWGLGAMIPIGILVFQEELTLFEAGTRALAILAAVMCLRWVTDRAVRGLAWTLDGGADEGQDGS